MKIDDIIEQVKHAAKVFGNMTDGSPEADEAVELCNEAVNLLRECFDEGYISSNGKVIKMNANGTWWFKSKEDPRWDVYGRGMVGGFCNYDFVPEAKQKMDELEKKFGKHPKDLEFGYMKD